MLRSTNRIGGIGALHAIARLRQFLVHLDPDLRVFQINRPKGLFRRQPCSIELEMTQNLMRPLVIAIHFDQLSGEILHWLNEFDLLILGPFLKFAHHEGIPQWIALFDGKTSKGWRNPYEWGKVEVVEGEMHLTGSRKFFLVSEKTYADFIFEGEILLPKGTANSGFMFRAHVGPNQVCGYPAEVDGSSRKWAGGPYDEGPRAWFISPKGGDKESKAAFRKRAGDAFKRHDWNTYRITCKGDRLKIEVNGVVTTDVKDDKDAAGVVGIQHHGEKGQTYRFRNLKIKELK
ncbi:MAG: hypothetical protein ACJAVK_001950 [Akkermansiaceae bacterium]